VNEQPVQEQVSKPGQELQTAHTQAGSALDVIDIGEDAGLGMENLTRDEFLIPFIRILQSNSPQVDETSQTRVPGAKAGMFLNTGTGEMIDGKEGFIFVPVYREGRNFVEFTPRNLGGGFVGIRSVDDPLVVELRTKQGEFGKLWTGSHRDQQGLPLDGTEIAETRYLYGLLMENEEAMPQRVVIGFSSTQIRKHKAFVGRYDNIVYMDKDGKPVKPTLWSHKWRVNSAPEKNKKGSFFGFVITLAAKKPDGSEDRQIKSYIRRSEPLYHAGRAFYDMIKGGKARADYAKSGGAETTEETEIPM
jgi:hypothetical protein